MANSGSLTPPEVLAKIKRLAERYSLQFLGNPTKKGKGSGGNKGRRNLVLDRIARETGINRAYLWDILRGRRRKAAIERLSLSINSLNLIKGTGKLCRKCSNPMWVFCFPSRICPSCELTRLSLIGAVTILPKEPEVPDDVP